MPDGDSNIAAVLGGGNSGPNISQAICDREEEKRGTKESKDIMHVVSVGPGSDSGGNSGKRRKSHGILPPGDVRRYLIAHSKRGDDTLRRILQYRFPEDDPVFPDESMGNLIALVCEKIWGRNEGARRFLRLPDIRGEVHYASKHDTHLVARLSDGRVLYGEEAIDTRSLNDDATIEKVWLEPRPIADTGVIEAILQAKVVIIAPGDFYSSIMAILLVEFMLEALNNSSAKVIVVVQLMTKKPETHGYDAATFIDKLYEYGLRNVYAALVNTGPIPKALQKKYAAEKSYPVAYNAAIKKRIEERGIRVVEGNFLSREHAKKERYLRHDPKKVVDAIYKLLDEDTSS